MKILYVCSDPYISVGGRGGGFTTHMEEMVASLRKLGHDVHILDTKSGERDRGTPSGGRQAPKIPRHVRVLLRDILYCLHNLRFHRLVSSRLARERDFDFIYERCCLYQFATVLAAKKWRLPVVLEFNAWIDETKLTDGLALRPLAAFIERFVARRAAAVITVSGFLKEYLVRRGIEPKKIYVLHNAVNLDTFRVDIAGDGIRKKIGLASEDIVVGFVGGFSVWHGAHLLLDVAPLARKENRKIRFFMVGGREGNPRFEGFKKSVEERGLTEAFRFAGEVPRSDVPEYIAAMDIAIIPWATEYGSPTKTFEYMGMGKAFVAPRVAALMEVLSHGKNAWLVSTGNIEEMASALVKLAADQKLREELGRSARRAAEEIHNWDRNAARTIEIAHSHGRAVRSMGERGSTEKGVKVG